MTKKQPLVFQFKITLLEIKPTIWRRIQVPSTYSFWDLHVAIQDAMGWLDYHLHAFEYDKKYARKKTYIGIPDDDYDDIVTLPGWEIKIATVFDAPGKVMKYDYDFGDGWHHEILFEGILLADPSVQYPVCLAGARACPPEDCGSIPGYYELLKTLKKGKGTEYKEMVAWLKDHQKCYWPYDPDLFDPAKVEFENPRKRFKIAFEDGE